MARCILCLSAILLLCCTSQGVGAKTNILIGGILNTYWLYTRDNPRVPVQISATAASAASVRLRSKAVIIVHDREGSYRTSLNPIVKNALLTAEDVNVIVVDWSLVAQLPYETAVGAASDIGNAIADLIKVLVTARRITLQTLHLVGFGVGAHIVAYTARAFTTVKVARITGLDPAGNLWTANTGRLNMNDADYVEVIHTDSSGNGISERLGIADFFPNGGIYQEGCEVADNKCHHDRAWELFAATLTHGSLVGNLCKADTSPSDANCRGYILVMGNNDLNKYGEGRFFLETSDKFPYEIEVKCVVCPSEDSEPTPEPEPTPGPEPTEEPITEPTESPITEPTEEPITEPTESPITEPTESPITEPTASPTPEPVPTPGPEPTESPITEPTESPTLGPEPTESPITEPTESPTPEPEPSPEPVPTPEPLPTPEPEPTESPTPEPESTPEPVPTPEPEPTE